MSKKFKTNPEEGPKSDFLNIKDRIWQLLTKNRFTDVSFAVGRNLQIIQAHKAIISAASPVFAKMFYGSLPEKSDQPIETPDLEPIIFYKMLKFMYADEIELESLEEAFQLFYASKKYLFHQLSETCLNNIKSRLQDSNALELYKFSTFFDETQLQKTALEVIKSKTISVLNSKDFASIDISTLTTIFEQKELQATEMELYLAFESKAAANNCLSSSDPGLVDETEKFRKAFRLIQFYLMTTEQFTSGPAFSKFISPDESIAITACIERPSMLKTLYPENFAQDIRNRKNLPHVFFDVKIDDSYIGRIVVLVRSDVVPQAAKAFLRLCNARNSKGLKGCSLKKISQNYCEVTYDNGERFELEESVLSTKLAGSVALEQYSWHSSLFSLVMILNEENLESRKLQGIGNIVKGMDVLKSIIDCHSNSGDIRIGECGKLRV